MTTQRAVGGFTAETCGRSTVALVPLRYRSPAGDEADGDMRRERSSHGLRREADRYAIRHASSSILHVIRSHSSGSLEQEEGSWMPMIWRHIER
jgi:hypothetical protein